MKPWWRLLLFLACLDTSFMLVLRGINLSQYHSTLATGFLNIAIAIWVW